MKKLFTASLWIAGFSLLLSIGCTQMTPEFEIQKTTTSFFPDGLPIRLSTTDYNNQNTYYLLNDD